MEKLHLRPKENLKKKKAMEKSLSDLDINVVHLLLYRYPHISHAHKKMRLYI